MNSSPPPDFGSLVAFGLLGSLILFLLVMPYLLKLACLICRVTQPSYGSALATVFIVGAANFGVGFVSGFIQALIPDKTPSTLLTIASLQLIAGILVTAFVYSGRFEIGIFHALGLYLVQMVALVPLVALFVVVVLMSIKGSLPGRSAPAVEVVRRAPALDLTDAILADVRKFGDGPADESPASAPAAAPRRATAGVASAPTAPAVDETRTEASGSDVPSPARPPRNAFAANPARASQRPAMRSYSRTVVTRSSVNLSTGAAAGDVDGLLAEMDDAEIPVIRHGADGLSRLLPKDDRRAEVLAKAAPLMKHPDGFVRWSVSECLKTWCDEGVVETLIEALDDESFQVRSNAFDSLGKLRDARGAGPVVAHFKSNKIMAEKALRAMGPAAEPALIVAVDDPEWTTRLTACEILKDVGSAAAVPVLRKHLRDENGLVKMKAGEALRVLAPPVEAPASTKKKRRL